MKPSSNLGIPLIAVVLLALGCARTQPRSAADSSGNGHAPTGPVTEVAVQLKMTNTDEGIRFGLVRDLPKRPLPTVFFLGGPATRSLTDPQYVEAQKVLGPEVLCVTLDTPAEGEDRQPDEVGGLRSWRQRIENGKEITTDFARRATAVLNYLVRQQATDPSKVAAFGTSRGGFMAFHFAANEPRIRCIAGFAPVTDLRALEEFRGLADETRVLNLSAIRLADRLWDRRIWILIGSTDHRVDTDRAIEFSQGVIKAAEAHGVRPGVELQVVPSDGHRVPEGTYSQAALWLLLRWTAATAP